ncbi:transcriptional regulator [Actinobacteria bacterium YIM 96077]|uniref:Transcriptional regulator n=1 Tax=Phytoactinopolyspora halophila TaxID=1981511 RepID=A0A329QCV0_9ACTN|nr:helix-turn-helix domain-containing protein [Phytoactinopolyspora halophila]AYY14175.1 transcriptional regulator [Actinobacteria bacterium YIM 96077]RAW10233.1 transcriptional regulator [Phytoactinopolyspora halophila]
MSQQLEPTPNTRGTALAELAALLADHTRAAFCLALLDGRAWTAGELARHVGVARSTASEHLDRLVARGLLAERRQGRHRYIQLTDHRVAELIEDLAAAARPVRERGRTLRAATTSTALARARTCYDHLAGRLGVAVTDAMAQRGFLDLSSGIALTDAGHSWLADTIGIDMERLHAGRRPLVRSCLDWTERRTHLAGAAGAHLCQQFQEREWIRRIGTDRAVRLTSAGQAALSGLLGIDPAALDLEPASLA